MKQPTPDFTILQPLLRIAGWIAIVLICILALVPGNLRPHTGAKGQMEHFMAYFLTAAVLALAYSRAWFEKADGFFPARTGSNLSMSRIFSSIGPYGTIAVLIAFAVVLEILQIWVPGRDAKFIDAAASSAGALLGTGFVFLLRRLPVLKFE
jgi:Flp pilus assembly pilin Flp